MGSAVPKNEIQGGLARIECAVCLDDVPFNNCFHKVMLQISNLWSIVMPCATFDSYIRYA